LKDIQDEIFRIAAKLPPLAAKKKKYGKKDALKERFQKYKGTPRISSMLSNIALNRFSFDIIIVSR